MRTGHVGRSIGKIDLLWRFIFFFVYTINSIRSFKIEFAEILNITMTSFARLIEDLFKPKIFPSNDRRYVKIQFFYDRSLGTGIKSDGSYEEIALPKLYVSNGPLCEIIRWKHAVELALVFSISEPVRHWVIADASHYYLAEQSMIVPEVLDVYKIGINGKYNGCAKIDIRKGPYADKPAMINAQIIAAFIKAITLTIKMCANGRKCNNQINHNNNNIPAREYRDYYNRYRVSDDLPTFLRFIREHFGAMSGDIRNFIAEWLNGAMAGFIITDQPGRFDYGDIIIEQMPEARGYNHQWHEAIWKQVAADHHLRVAQYHKHILAPVTTALKPIVCTVLEKYLDPVTAAYGPIVCTLLERNLSHAVISAVLKNIDIIVDSIPDDIKYKIKEKMDRDKIGEKDHIQLVSTPVKDLFYYLTQE